MIPSTFQFVLFLFIQQLASDPKKSLRRSLSGENWPDNDSDCGSISSISSRRKEEIASKNAYSTYDENSLKNFVKDKISTIINIYHQRKNETENISIEAIQALDLIILAYSREESGYKANSFSEHIIGQSKITMRSLKQILAGHLMNSPGGYLETITNGHQVEDWVENSGHVITNAQTVQEGNGRKLILTSMSDQIFLKKLPVPDFDVMLHRLEKCTVYLLYPMRSLSIERCKDCVIFLGPVSTVAKISNCKNIEITIPTRKFIVTNSSDISSNILTTSHPLILSQCSKITLGPFNTNYKSLSRCLQYSGIKILGSDMFARPVNLFDKLIAGIVTSDSSRKMLENQKSNTTEMKILQSKEVMPASLPVSFGKTVELKDLLQYAPKVYQMVWDEKLKITQNLRDLIKNEHIEGSTLLENVQDYFHDWIDESGLKDKFDKFSSKN